MAAWPPRVQLDKLKLITDLSKVVALDGAMEIKVKTMTSEELLRFAFSITETTAPHPDITTHPFRFKTATIMSRAKPVATDCVTIFRRLVAVNVIAERWSDAAACAPGQREMFAALGAALKVHRLVVPHGDLPPALTPVAVSVGFGILLEAVVLYHTSVHIPFEDQNATMLGRSVRTLCAVWDKAKSCGVLDRYSARLVAAAKAKAIEAYNEAICKYQQVPPDGPLAVLNSDAVAIAVADAWLCAPHPSAELEVLVDVYLRRKGRHPGPMTIALADNVPPSFPGALHAIPVREATATEVLGEPYVL